jgi:DNA-directed RNA polymerase subunit H (RpoH/RPB5)
MDEIQIRKMNVLLGRRGFRLNIESSMPVNKTNCTVFEIESNNEDGDGNNCNDGEDDDNNGEDKFLLFASKQSVGKAEVLKIIAFAENISHFILFSQNVSLQATNILQNLPNVFAEILNDKDIAFDKCSSKLVSSYKILNKFEIAELLQKKCMKIGQLPKMLSCDAMSRYLGFSNGSVVHAIDVDVYRLVVKK